MEPVMNKQSTGKLVSLESIDFNSVASRRVRINSPRSLEALNRLGLTADELFYESFKEFKANKPDVRTLPKDLQKSRWEYIESRRLEKIEELKKIRSEIASEFPDLPDLRSNTLNRPSKSASKSVMSGDVKSTAINNELKALERLKKKQEMELLNMVQYELKMELMRKENETNLRKQKEREDEVKHQIMLNNKKEEEKKKQREKELAEKQMHEEEERKKRDMLQYQEEQKRLKEEMKAEKERLKNARLKQEEEKKKQEEFKKKIEDMLEENKRNMELKQAEMDKREEERLQVLERKKLELMMINEEKAMNKKEKIEINQKNLEFRLKSQREEFEEKQNRNEMKRINFENMRGMAFKEKKEQSEARTKEIQEVLRRNEEMEKDKVKRYYEKQKIIEIKKSELDEVLKERQKEKEKRQKEKEYKLKYTLAKNEEIINEKKSITLSKIMNRDFKVDQVSKIREREFMEKSEYERIKRIDKEERLKQLARLQEYEKLKILERLNEKSQRLDEFNFQRSQIAEQKRGIYDDIVRKKQEYTQKFEKIFKRKNFDEKSIQELVTMFPDNPEVYAMIEALKQNNENKKSTMSAGSKQHSAGLGGKNSRMSNTDANFYKPELKEKKKPKTPIDTASSFNQRSTANFNKTANNISGVAFPTVLDEKGILKKVNEFRLKLNQNLLKLLSEERQKEDERERMLLSTKDAKERKKLEDVFGFDRAQASSRIVRYNE